MVKYICKRILYMIFVFLVMSLVLFFLYNLIPGDPARAQLEPIKDTLTPEEYQFRYAQARKQLGLDDPPIIRYGKWMKGILKGDFGMSSVYKQPVKDVVTVPLKNTVFINIFVIALVLLITIPLGIRTAVKKHSGFDKTIQVLTVVGYSVPIFITGLLFIFIFAVKLQWFPVSGMTTPNFKGTEFERFLDIMYHLSLPIIILVVTSLAGVTRYVRAAMIDALSMDYIKTARAKGLKEKVVIYSHAWKNALLPVITLIIAWIMSVFSGSLVIERMFNLHGMGNFYINALNNQDYNVALAIQLFYIIIALLSNLVTDISYGFVDPRVRIDQ
ncbi:MAG: Peptide/nickel transport system permease protein [Sporanaerobacter sp.]|jgi:peptide/nickel transport system permease protein|uniref:ABC transporter permease n=1 Tax=Sporanaerobacter sp. TaxID=2010183 RepID=UPI003A0FCF8C